MSQFKWSNLWKGFAMGTTDLVPGVSGGTIALLLGIYDDFIQSVSGIFSKRIWKSLQFLIPIGLGMVIAIGLLSKVINYLLSEHTVPTMFFFVGLIAGIIPYLLKTARVKETFNISHYLIMLLGIVIIVVITLLNNGDKHAGETLELSTGLIIKYFIAGVCASSAMLLPGISGSFMLLVFGVYGTVMFSISEFMSLNFNAIPILLTVGLGIIFGFLFSSKLIQYLLNYYTYLTYALIIGFVVGSLYAVFPGLPSGAVTWGVSIILVVLGYLISYRLGRITSDDF
ncbi:MULTISPECIES: DUF368 domain-containing protein [Staphylococcus]|jgi:putative membrane protein|uniref:DUF368 domain-containing protein n=2 Tax=Staphylococcus nepalensis TaxID=214473 RepID=A0A2T4SA85_9STAP|nr:MULTISPECIES: DUF368 domain-containing protein [Staphylococcus]VDG67689.1 membrane protein [Lacrimispora indolis]MBO1206705.1 DUF368 domain-containing protein [Staphylococcus nepalensis]MBO1214136.1 DUF368 domain-containing protein [Staphylococcus nepalensis]MBO1216567.1 DUF368 domain-containing protein [Staphylococcus nepalensis]MBO1220255.1 DUF368 domain-containing protein [Staphylococcus nepalensis]